jgi:ribosomal protein S12 methylthiotransferase accessory factor
VISTLPQRPVLKRHLRTTTVAQSDVFVLAEDRAWLWKSRGLGVLLGALDGRRTLADLFTSLGSQLSPPEIIHLLNQLDDLGLLAEVSDPPPAGRCEAELSYWHALGAADDGPATRVHGAAIRLHTIASAGEARLLADALGVADITAVIGPDGDAALEVVVTDHYLRPELTAVNDLALASGSPWMVCTLTGRTLWIGPVLHPGRTGCLACLQNRVRLNHQIQDFVVRKTGDTRYYLNSVAAHPAAARLGAAWAAHEIAGWLGGRTERLEGRLLSVTLGPRGPDVTTHTLVRRPQCPACGSPVRDGRAAVPVVLRSRPVVSTGGSHRSQHPEETLRRLAHHISPITGVVTQLSEDARDPEGLLHTYSARHHFALGPDTVHWLRHSMRSRTKGKGTTAEAAKAGALCEAIERYCGVFRDGVPRIRATYRELGQRAVHPSRCLNFSDAQYDNRDELNARNAAEGTGFDLIPHRFPEDLEIDWVPLWSLTRAETRYLPAAFCYYAHPDVERHFYCTGEANGCAAGNCLEEAVLEAFLELVERDAAAIWWYNRAPRPAVDLASVADSYLARIRERYARAGRELWALDLTSDLEIPVIACVSRRVDGPAEDLLVGFGAHLDPSTALRRAVTEVNQFLPAVTGRAADGHTRYSWPDDAAVRFWTGETLTSQPQLVPAPDLPIRTLAQFPPWPHTDLLDAVGVCLDATRRLGLDVLVLDQSRPDIDLSVTRVVVPGFRHFWRRLGPGRLYDVPVRLGWVPAPTAEADLNPTSIFF